MGADMILVKDRTCSSDRLDALEPARDVKSVYFCQSGPGTTSTGKSQPLLRAWHKIST